MGINAFPNRSYLLRINAYNRQLLNNTASTIKSILNAVLWSDKPKCYCPGYRAPSARSQERSHWAPPTPIYGRYAYFSQQGEDPLQLPKAVWQ